jgi:uncharacterized protein YyaL (SSP411 family)
VSGLLDDQVQVASASIDAYETTGATIWLDWAQQLMDDVWADYWDGETGGLFDTARSRTSQPGLLPAPAKPIQDTPTPSPNGVAGIVLTRLQELTGHHRWGERADSLLRAFAGRADELGLYAATYLLAVDWYLNPATHIVIVGDPHDPTAHVMHRHGLANFLPRRVVQLIEPAGVEERPLPTRERVGTHATPPVAARPRPILLRGSLLWSRCILECPPEAVDR